MKTSDYPETTQEFNVGNIAKFITAVIGVTATYVFDTYGVAWGLPPDWPEMVTSILTPVAVYFIPNKEN